MSGNEIVKSRLTNSQVIILRSLFTRSGGRPVPLDADWQREFAPNLARRGLVEIWNRQRIGDDHVSRGPFLTLTIAGAHLAQRLFHPAPRGFRGLECLT
jgi:hypothetical protein